MNLEIMPLIAIAALTGVIHTLMGPDHYLPFIALAKAQSWSRNKTIWITSLCGLGHILSSVVIGYLALGFRMSLNSLHVINSYRSDFAAWALIAFGCAYFVWSLKRLYKGKEQASDFSTGGKFNPILLGLFIIFIVGPCEPLFFLMTYPSLIHNPLAVVLLIGVFGLATIMTMLTAVLGASFELSPARNKRQPEFSYMVLGLVLIFCGFGIKFLGM